MNYLMDLCKNSILQTALISWFAAQLIKVIIVLIIERRVDFTRITGSGGMPSSHSSFTVSLAAAIGFTDGFDSVAFALAAAFSLVVMYDASGVRRSAGQQAAILNRIVEKLGKEELSATGKKLKELLGHTPMEVVAGALLGLIIAIIQYA
ncbi:MAG TPA: divergent PAP2 family protein [Candidatus Ornithomonoglobus merdipullorum]|uniref:Divergent PAP2 family protein n=1 Tax=Candidatus Ornithomonoglobus merdipullorum TaxID=2840895 RepID=A0A9D1MDC6_9FIRM|nr:divergent PAP2 family protein [Candidatus Ornithomonoglobus merdipullorum]